MCFQDILTTYKQSEAKVTRLMINIWHGIFSVGTVLMTYSKITEKGSANFLTLITVSLFCRNKNQRYICTRFLEV
jgi:hypothetical protein